MGNKFIEKHRRKSILATLLFIFRGRTKFIAILLMVTILSVPFVISGEMLGRIIELRPVAAFLRSVGMASVVSALNPKYSNDLLKAALDKAAEDSQNNSFWNKFLKNINSTLPPGGGQSTITLVRGGGDIFGLPEVKDPKGGKTGPGNVKGVVNEEERSRGETGDDVNLESLMARGADGEGGLYGDVMGENLADRFGGAGNAPYVGSSMMGGGPSVGGRSNGMYSKVYSQSGAKVPMPGKPSKVNTKSKMGRVSGFTWKNVGYGKKNAKMDVKLSNQRPMFQLAQTFALTATAYNSKKSAAEYQAAYTGATYDGNDVNLDVMETDAAGTKVPDTAMTGNLITGAGDMQDAAKACSEAQGTHGAKMSEDGNLMDDTIKSLGKPPKCCSHGAVDAWNGKVNTIFTTCIDFNMHEAQLATACQNKSSPMDCNSYNSMRIKKCSKWKCFLSLILAILLIIVGLLTGQIWMVAIGVGMLVSQMFPGILGMIFGALLGFGLFSGLLSQFTQLVTGVASKILTAAGEDMPAEDE